MDGEELTRRRVEIINEKRFDQLGTVLAPGIVTHYGAQDLEGLDALAAALAGFGAFSDLHTSVEALAREDDRVGARYLTRGRHTGEFMGVAPSGAEVVFGGAGINRIAGGLIVETWTVDDFSTLVRQIGAIPDSA